MRSACSGSHDISEEGAKKDSVVVGEIGQVSGPGMDAVGSGGDLLLEGEQKTKVWFSN